MWVTCASGALINLDHIREIFLIEWCESNCDIKAIGEEDSYKIVAAVSKEKASQCFEQIRAYLIDLDLRGFQ